MADFLFWKYAEGRRMLRKLLDGANANNESEHKEGELYKIVTTYGKTFELRYGYYCDKDRENPLCEPAVIYPDFTDKPLYTDNGEPFVTMMQDACRGYRGESKKTRDTTCAECKHFMRGEEWFGICVCPYNRKAQI